MSTYVLTVCFSSMFQQYVSISFALVQLFLWVDNLIVLSIQGNLIVRSKNFHKESIKRCVEY